MNNAAAAIVDPMIPTHIFREAIVSHPTFRSARRSSELDASEVARAASDVVPDSSELQAATSAAMDTRKTMRTSWAFCRVRARG
jgi:hypothetical protein